MSRLYDLAMVRNDRGRLGLFAAVGPEADYEQPQVVWHTWRDPGDPWTLWQSLGGPLGGFSTRLAVEANSDGRFEVMVDGPESAVWHTWQRANGEGWRGWHSLGRQAY
jgi:hypothetical protein